MTAITTRLACLALLCTATALPCQADSVASSAASGSSASVGSLSDSIRGSSDSSSPNRTAAGDYRIEEVAELENRPEMRRLRLQATARPGADGALFLDLPAVALAQAGLAAGDTVAARQRPYGIEFARVDTRQAFFLVLADDWYREIDPRAVSL
jgi:hypothetical protein